VSLEHNQEPLARPDIFESTIFVIVDDFNSRGLCVAVRWNNIKTVLNSVLVTRSGDSDQTPSLPHRIPIPIIVISGRLAYPPDVGLRTLLAL